MTDPKIIKYIDQMCEKNGEVEIKNITTYGQYTIVVPVFNGELCENQIATLDMEFTFDGEDATLFNFPKNLLSNDDYIFITESIEEIMVKAQGLIRLAEKYDFQIKERIVSTAKLKSATDLRPCIDLCAKNTDNEWTPWITYYSLNDHLVYHGNTDHLNIWLHKTRKDFTPEKCLEFVSELNKTFNLSEGNTFLVEELIDPEDWQEIANVRDAYEDVRYTGFIYEINCGSREAMDMIAERGKTALNPKTMKFQIIDKDAKYQVRLDEVIKDSETGKETECCTLLSNKDLWKIAREKGLVVDGVPTKIAGKKPLNEQIQGASMRAETKLNTIEPRKER